MFFFIPTFCASWFMVHPFLHSWEQAFMCLALCPVWSPATKGWETDLRIRGTERAEELGRSPDPDSWQGFNKCLLNYQSELDGQAFLVLALDSDKVSPWLPRVGNSRWPIKKPWSPSALLVMKNPFGLWSKTTSTISVKPFPLPKSVISSENSLRYVKPGLCQVSCIWDWHPSLII